MGLSQALSNAYSGLSSSSRLAEMTSHNIANAATPGFQRREAELAAQSIAGQGQGVLFLNTTLATSALTADRREAEADYAYQGVIAETTGAYARIVGDSDDPGSLFARYQSFEDSLALLAETPDSQQLQLDAFNRATDLVTEFNDAQSELLNVREDADREIDRQVDRLNTLLSEFDELNDNIEKFFYRGEDVTEMTAQREGLIDEISKYIPVEVADRPGERIALVTSGGFTLVDADAPTVAYTASNAVDPTMDYVAEVAGGLPPTLSGLTINGFDVTPSTATGNPIGGGSLDALFQVRDVTSIEFQTSLDAMASDLIARFDDAAVDPTITAGNPGLFTDNQNDDSGAVGLAGRLEVNNAVDPDNGGALENFVQGMEVSAPALAAGDNTIVVGMLNALSTARAAPNTGVSGTLSATDLAAQFSSKYSTLSVGADATLSLVGGRLDSLVQQEQSETGVDLDYELQNLNLIQTAYSANARVLEVVDQMLRRLMEI